MIRGGSGWRSRAVVIAALMVILGCAPASSPTPSTSGRSEGPSASPATVPGQMMMGGVDVEPGIRPTQYVGANPQSWWCAMPYCTPDFDVNGQGPLPTINLELLDAKMLGAAVVRVEFPWPLIEVGRGTFDWARSDAIMDAARAKGVPILPIVTWTPRWAGGGPGLNAPPHDDGDWTTFVTAVVERYGSQFSHGVDLWNEPDDGSYFAGDPQEYVSDILNPAYSVIKALSPHTPVVMAGSANDAGSCCPWAAAVVKDGGRFDVAAFHDYAGNSAAVGRSLSTILAAAGRGGTPIWLTEYSVDSTTSDQSQAIASVFTSGVPIQAAIWYNLRDTNSYSCCPPSVVKRAHWGLLDSDFTAKAGFYALQRRLGGRGRPEAPATTSSPSAA